MVHEELRCRLFKLLREETALNLKDQSDLMDIGPDVIDILIEALDGNDRRQLVNATSILEQIGACHASRAIPALLALQTHSHTWVRMSSAKAIGILGSVTEVAVLTNWLQAEMDVLVQVWIVTSLGRLGGTEAVTPLLMALHNTESSTLRYTIIRALGDLGDSRVSSVIESYLSDEDCHVRNDAHEALKKLRKVEQESRNGYQ
jgi:HEAT repeat protein